jgi:hypothetical protein
MKPKAGIAVPIATNDYEMELVTNFDWKNVAVK